MGSQTNGVGPAGPPAHLGINFTPTIHHDTYPAISPSASASNMVDKHVFITGASRGIGKSMAAAYAKAGASVIGISARSDLSQVKKEVEDASAEATPFTGRVSVPKVVAVEMDVSSQESIQRAVDEKLAPAFQGRLDVLISNAGSMEEWRPVLEADVDEWWRTWDINIKGQFMVWKALIPLLLADDSSLKTVVTLSSVGAHMSSPGASAYQTSKLAVIRLSEFLNAEYGEKGLIAYCMHPGSVPTDLSAMMPAVVRQKLVDTPELMSDTVVFLTQKRREWLRGRYLSCNWDMPELLGMEEEIVEKDKLKIRMVV
ncbi:MAG: hypothetical protein M1831_001603 [Alyxoria varia]|nr:MAG: hypothetical protein M1831_001603 [Alyxoria varia]